MVVEWRFHSRQAGTPRRATNPQTGGRRPKKRLLRQVSPPVARGTVADGPSRYWCTYWRRCGNDKAGTPRGRPSQGTAGSNRRTGGHQPKDWQTLFFNNVSYREFFLDFGGYVSEVARVAVVLWFGAWCVALGSLLLFPSLFLFTRSTSDVVPVTFLPSSFFFNSGRAEQFPKLFHSVYREVHPKPLAFSLPTDRNSPRD